MKNESKKQVRILHIRISKSSLLNKLVYLLCILFIIY